MTQDLQSWLVGYEAANPDEVVRIRDEVDSRHIPTAMVAELDRRGLYPILVFERVRLADGSPSAYPVVTNLFASRRRTAQMVGCEPRTLAAEYSQKARADIDPVVVPPESALVREVVKTGDAVDLTRFPALMHHELDPGPYMTGGFFTCYHPETAVDNCGLHRAWVRGPRELRVLLAPHSHAKKNLLAHERLGRDMKVAFWQGHHPVAILGGQVKRAWPASHFAAMGGLLGTPLRLTPSVSLGDDFLVPADAELVVEGVMVAGERASEGPFGEFTGYSGPQVASAPAFRVTAVSHRRNLHWHDIHVGYADNRVMGCASLEAAVYRLLAEKLPSFRNCYMPVSGLARYHVYVQLHEPLPGEAREAILCALMAHSIIKHVFVFDSDVDIFDEQEVLWAIATRTQWDRDTIVLPHMRGSRLDPSAPLMDTCKGGIDCTRPSDQVFEERNVVPPDVLARIRPEDYLS